MTKRKYFSLTLMKTSSPRLCFLSFTAAACWLLLSSHSALAQSEPGILQPLPPPAQELDQKAPFIIKAVNRCIFGDMDAMVLDVMWSRKDGRMLLTLEPLDAGGQSSGGQPFEPVVRDIGEAPGVRESGFRFEMNLPQLDKPTVMGLFICKDTVEANRCANKELMPINKILGLYKIDRGKEPNYQASDKIYFFKFLVVAEGKVYFPSITITNSRAEELEKALVGLGFSGSAALAASKQIRKYDQTLGSTNLHLTNDGALEIALPKFSKEKCG